MSSQICQARSSRHLQLSKAPLTFGAMNDWPDNLQVAIAAAGGAGALAKTLGITSQAVSQWDRAPTERVLDIVRACDGVVTCHDLRPDKFPEVAA